MPAGWRLGTGSREHVGVQGGVPPGQRLGGRRPGAGDSEAGAHWLERRLALLLGSAPLSQALFILISFSVKRGILCSFIHLSGHKI